MKTKWHETLIIVLTMIFIVIAAFFLTKESSFFTTFWIGDYHVIADFILFCVLTVLLSGTLVRAFLVLKPLRVLTCTLDSRKAFYWKLVAMVAEIGGATFSSFVPLHLRAPFYRIIGARIGKKTIVSGEIVDPFLVEIGAYVMVGKKALLVPHDITYNRLHIEPIKIGDHATIGIGAIIMPGVSIGEGSILAPDAIAVSGTKIPPYEFWGGEPAVKIKKISKRSL